MQLILGEMIVLYAVSKNYYFQLFMCHQKVMEQEAKERRQQIEIRRQQIEIRQELEHRDVSLEHIG